MGRLNRLQSIKPTSGKGRLSQLATGTEQVEDVRVEQKKGFIKQSVEDVQALGKGDISVGDVAREVPGATKKVVGGFVDTFVPALKNFFVTTGSIFGEGLAYAVDPNVRKQYRAGNLDILPTISGTTPADVAKDTIAAGIETAVYRSFPGIVKMNLLPRGGAGALQGMGFAISEGLANDKSAEEIVKSLPTYGVFGGTLGIVSPYILPLLKAEMKALPKEIQGVFKGLVKEAKDIKLKPRGNGRLRQDPQKQLPAPEERLLLTEGTPETIELPGPKPKELPAPRERLLLQAGVKPVVEPTKIPVYKSTKITRNTKLQQGDIISVQGVDRFIVTEVKKARVTPRGREQMLELKNVQGNTFEESVLDLTGATQIRKVGEKSLPRAKQPKVPEARVRKITPRQEVKEKPVPARETRAPARVKEPPPVIPETRKTAVPREQLPVGEGKTKVSRLEARVKGVLDDVSPKKADEAGITTFKQMNKADQLRKASEYVEKNPDDALDVLRGDKPAPEGLLHNSIALALEEKAALGQNSNLAIKLASLRSSRAGQEISILTEAQPNNPISAIQEIIKARVERAQRKAPRGKTVSNVVAETQKIISEAAGKKRLKIAEAETLLEGILC